MPQFVLNHEIASFSGYQSVYAEGAEIEVTLSGGLNSTDYGISVSLISGAVSAYAQYNHLALDNDYVVVSAYIDPGNLIMADGDSVIFLQMLKIAPSGFFDISLAYTDPNFTVALTAYEDDGGSQATSVYTVTAAEHVISVNIARASTVAADDGTATLSIDGTLKETLSDLDNYNIYGTTGALRVGAITSSVVDPTTSGELYLDEITLGTFAEAVGAQITATLTDSVGITDALNTARMLIKTLTEAVGITDTLTTARNLIVGLADSIDITDTLSRIRGIIVTLADSIGITDTVTNEVAEAPPSVLGLDVWPIDYLTTVGGDDISINVVSMAFKSGICNPIGQLEIVVAPNLDFDVIPYQEVIIYIDETKVFTGYVQTGVFSRRPYTQIIHCEDALSRVRDTWNHDLDIESHGEAIEHWIDYFLRLSGVTYTISGGGPPTDSRLWGVVNAYQAIASLLKLVNWQLTTDATGVIHVQQHARDANNAIAVPRITDWERVQSDEWLRNRAVVLGRNEESSVIVDNYIEALEGEIRAAIVASPHIIWPATAYRMAWLILNEFSTPLDTVTVQCPGNPVIRVGSTVNVRDRWEGHARNGLVTSCQWRISEREGYIMTLALDEKCPTFWLADIEPEILYCATEGEGVWKTYNDGESWFDISGDDLSSGLPSYVKDIHVIKGISLIGTDDTVWAATLGGIYKTETGAHPWTDITVDFMDSKAQNIDWWGVQVGPIDHDKIYCLGNYDAPSASVTDDSGEVVGTLPPRWTIYMYISLDGGTTWNDYIVNSYSLGQ